WFGAEARRVYAVLGEDDVDRERRRLIEWVERKGGTVVARDLQMGDRRYRGSAEAAEQALADLVEAGIGRWVDIHPTAQGGTPTPALELVNSVNVNETPGFAAAAGGFVDVDAVDGEQTAGLREVFQGEI